jgi:phage repressor protein C with HTH and peptisase S24 domain
MVDYTERLRLALKQSGCSVQMLADGLGISYQAAKKALDGKTRAFTASNNMKAAKLLGVSAEWLATGEGEVKVERTVSEILDGYRTIPQYDVAGAMGNGGLVLDEQPPGVIKAWSVDEQWVRRNVPSNSGIGNLCIVTGFGSSMQPMFNPGDPLLMDRGITECASDGVYFFRIGDHGWIKQLQRIPTANGVVIRAKSLNPSYDPFEITEGMDFHVLGKILMTWKSEKV